MPEVVDVYPYRLVDSVPEFLLLKRADNKQYAGQWRMVGGKVEACEAAWQSGLRELREETRLFPDVYWTVPSVNQFYDASVDEIRHIPVFAAEVAEEKTIILNEEHSDYKWIESANVNASVHWPEQQRLISLINKILTTQQILSEWKIPL